MTDWFSALMAFLISPLKYTVGVAIALFGDLHPLLAWLLTTAGAMAGVFVYVYLGKYLLKKFGIKRGKIHSKLNRILVRVRRSHGLAGIAFLTPILLSVPVGCFMALGLEGHQKRIVRYMFYSVLFWGVLIFGLKYLFGVDLSPKIK